MTLKFPCARRAGFIYWHTVSMRLPWLLAEDRTGPRMKLRPTQDHRDLEQTGRHLRAHHRDIDSRSRGTRGRGLFLGMGVPVLRTLPVEVLLDALQNRNPEGVHLLRVPPSRGGALGLLISPTNGLGELDVLAR